MKRMSKPNDAEDEDVEVDRRADRHELPAKGIFQKHRNNISRREIMLKRRYRKPPEP